MRMVVTGRNGQVVRSLIEQARGSAVEVVALGRPELDLAGSAEAIRSALSRAEPDVIVSAAAYTQVDKAESDRDLAFKVNESGARAVARAAYDLAVPLIHLSTDYVFGGGKTTPYAEEDPTDPTGVYGASKLAGERAVMAEQDNYAILRTAWVYSPFGANFVKTMLRLAGASDEIRVVADQRGNPSSALDVATGIIAVARNLHSATSLSRCGVFHMAGTGEASWADLAEAVFAASARAGGPTARVEHISTADYSTAARRPPNSRLDCGKLERTHGVCLPAWRPSLEQIVTRIVKCGV